MSSRREVLIRILALLQRKTLLYFTLFSPLFSFPPQGIWQLKSPHPREFAIQGKMLMPRVSPGGSWVQLELTHA